MIDVQISTRHSKDCPHKADPLYRRCDCRKSLRWTLKGQQRTESALTRSWTEAETARRRKQAELEGVRPSAAELEAKEQPMTIRAALDAFLLRKRVAAVSEDIVGRYKKELGRLVSFCEERNAYTVAALPVWLDAYKATWPRVYRSTYTRQSVQKRTKSFLGFCFQRTWLDRIPEMTAVKVTEPPTMPLSGDEYARLLAATPDVRTRTLIEVMRWSGLARSDAATLRRDELIPGEDGYDIVRRRQKTDVAMTIPVPDYVAKLLLDLPANGDCFFCEPGQRGSMCAKLWGARVSAAFTAAGIVSGGQMRSHRLRDTFAVGLLAQGVPMADVSRLLGHTSIATTQRHYAQWDKAQQTRIDRIVRATHGKA